MPRGQVPTREGRIAPFVTLAVISCPSRNFPTMSLFKFVLFALVGLSAAFVPPTIALSRSVARSSEVSMSKCFTPTIPLALSRRRISPVGLHLFQYLLS